MNPETEQVLLGSMCGDGSLRVQRGRTCFYNERHCMKQSNYLKWKMQFLEEYKPNYREAKDGCCYIYTWSHPELMEVHKMFYFDGSGIKTIRKETLLRCKKYSERLDVKERRKIVSHMWYMNNRYRLQPYRNAKRHIMLYFHNIGDVL